MWPWAAVYVGLVVLATVAVLARREPTVVRGDWVYLFTALYVLLAAVVTAIRGGRFSLGSIVVVSAVVLVGWFVQSRWWVVGADADAVAASIDECASRLCAPATRAAGSCIITVPGGAVRLRIVRAGRSTMIEFVSSARHRKAHLFRRLLAKQYRSVIPPLKLGVLGTRAG